MVKRIPPTRFPDAAAVQYARNMKKLISELHKMAMDIFNTRISTAIKEYQRELRGDSDSLDLIRQALDLIKTLSLGIFPSDTVMSMASLFVDDVDRKSAVQTEQQFRIKGIQPTDGLWLDSFKRSCVAENATLIKNIQEEYVKSVEVIVHHGTRTGKSMKLIRKDLQNRLGITERRANLIARDQTGKVFGQITERRHRDAGINKFKWSTSQDERVRKTHEELDGKIFDYDDPPSVGKPGDDYQCRCVAIPVFEENE